MIKEEVKKDYERTKKYGTGHHIKDDFHTMSELYFNRMVLFSVLTKSIRILHKDNPNIKVWKSFEHHPDDNFPMFDDFFIVGVSTPEGSYSYHYEIEYLKYFDHCETLDHSPKYDGHTSADIGFLYSLVGDSK